MIADGDTLFHSQANNFDFTQASMMFLDRSYPILAQTRRGYQRLYNVNGNQLPIYKQLSNRGLLGLTPGEQDVTIVATDYYGNTRTATFTLITDGSSKFTRPNNKCSHVSAASNQPMALKFQSHLTETDARRLPTVFLIATPQLEVRHR